jgi:hypothetical protein
MDLTTFGPGYIDLDEWRAQPVRHRYVHGGFEGTDTRFSLYLPPPESYRGRFFQFLEGGSAGHESTIADGGPLTSGALAHVFALGGYLIESNQGHMADRPERPKAGGSVCSYEASAAAARWSRGFAGEMYGSEPHHGYVYGVSGGGIRSIVCLERGEGTWDGAVPCAIPHAGMFYALAEHAGLMLGPKVDAVIDATDVGGSGDPFEGLDSEQREVLTDLYRSGYARGAEFMLRPGYSPVGYGMTSLYKHDPGYFDAFWTEAGYLGHDRPELLRRWQVQAKTVVSRVVTPRELIPPDAPPEVGVRMAMMLGGLDAPVAAVLDGLEPDDYGRMIGATLTVSSGAATGRMLYCTALMGPVVVATAYDSGQTFHDVHPGDEVTVDNRHHIAFRYSYRHEMTVDEDRFPEFHPEWQHLALDGHPVFPQRRPAWNFDDTVATELYQYRFAGKMLLVENALDGTNWPAHGHNYATRVHDHGGPASEEYFRLYWTDHAAHGPGTMYPAGNPPVVTTRVIDYQGILHAALRHLVGWVEEGIDPPASTGYTWSRDNALALAATAGERAGLQPVVDLTVNGATRAEVAVGETFHLAVAAEAPAGAGTIVALEWDFDGTGMWPETAGFDGSSARVSASASHSYDRPGTYFPAARVWAQMDHDAGSPLWRSPNLGRVRVEVS